MSLFSGFQFHALLVLATTILLAAHPTQAAVERIEITSREPYAEGQEVPGVGACEWIHGTVWFSVDPSHPANQTVIDLDLAPQNPTGHVEFSADLLILAPVDLTRASGSLLYDVNNRGRTVCLGQFDGGGADHFLLRQGFIMVWSGWIAELLPGDGRLLLRAPVATREDQPITGLVRSVFVSDKDTNDHPISHFANHGSYRPTEEGLSTARLSWRLNERDPRVAIPREQWSLNIRDVSLDGQPAALPEITLHVAGGIQAGSIYELIYEAQGPIVQGLGLAGIRDLIAHLRHDHSDNNPLRVADKSVVRHTLGFGVSQSGRCLRQLLYDGFNTDESGRRVFDGLIPHVAGGGMGFFNHRFASPTRHNTQHDNHLYPADVFPFTYGPSRDPFTGRSDSLLRRSQADDTVPLIMHTQSSSEYWHRAGSLVHTNPQGTQDAELPDAVRIYTFGGAAHGPGSGLPSEGGNGQLPRNPTDYRPLMRGLLMAMQEWVRDGKEPPPSVYPKLSNGTLARFESTSSGWQPLPAVRYPEVIHTPDFLDRGPEFLTRRRITLQPPQRMGSYGVRVPAYDADNNDSGCLQLPTLAVPLGSYTSWNLRGRSIGAETELLSLSGGYIPFPQTRTQRLIDGDPRLSLQERYDSEEAYLAAFRTHTEQLIRQRYVLPEDRPRLESLAKRLYQHSRSP